MDKKQIEDLIKRVNDESESRLVHIPYASATGKPPDFEVEYEICINPEVEEIHFTQGARCDFLYEGDDPAIDGIHMIWPEFLDKKGQVILDKKKQLDMAGRATMWILMDEMRESVHQKRIKVGAKGYWVVGSKKVAKVVVTKIIGLFENK